MSRSILVACHDAAAAEAIAPALAKVETSMPVHIVASPIAARALRRADKVVESLTAEEARALVSDVAPRLVLTGASWGGSDAIDKAVLVAARAAGIPVLSYVDYWANFRLRLGNLPDAGPGWPFLADRVAVCDEIARQSARNEGVPDELIEVVGNPRFDRLAAVRRSKDEIRAALATELGIGNSAQWIGFASQPLIKVCGSEAAARDRYGYTERDVFDGLWLALQELERSGTSLVLLYRRHVAEDAYLPYLEKDGAIVCCDASYLPLDDFLWTTDCLVGMSSTVLVDAYLMRTRVISFQPGIRNQDACVLSSCGLVPLVTSAARLGPAIAEMRSAPSSLDPRMAAHLAGGAAERLAGLVLRMTQSERPLSCHA